MDIPVTAWLSRRHQVPDPHGRSIRQQRRFSFDWKAITWKNQAGNADQGSRGHAHLLDSETGTTCFGEAFSDYVFFNDYIGRIKAILMGLALLLVCYAIQLATTRYIPWIYWLAVTAVAIFGTMSADFLNKNLGMPLWASTLMLLVLQSTVFIAWYATERTLNIHSITTHRRELFYWLTVLLTFALGTAAGDFAAGPLGLGTLASTLVFLGVILVPLAGWKWLGLNAVLAFWLAYTITRPLGASFGDFLAVPAPFGDGLQIGTGPISLASGIVLLGIIALIDVKYRRTKKVQEHGEVAVAAPPATRHRAG